MNDVVGRYKWVGTRPIRPDGVPKVTGKAMYAADYTMPGAIVGSILRSPHAHARIRSIDTSKAARAAGRQGGRDRRRISRTTNSSMSDPERVAVNFWHVTRNVMAREKALYEGHAVAAVAAIDAATAEEALSLIDVDYEVLPHVIDVDEAMKDDAPLLVRGHDHARRRAGPDQAVERLEKARIHRSAISRPASPRPTWSSRRSSRPPRCIRAISSRMPAACASIPTGRPRSGRRARAISSSAR